MRGELGWRGWVGAPRNVGALEYDGRMGSVLVFMVLPLLAMIVRARVPAGGSSWRSWLGTSERGGSLLACLEWQYSALCCTLHGVGSQSWVCGWGESAGKHAGMSYEALQAAAMVVGAGCGERSGRLGSAVSCKLPCGEACVGLGSLP